MHEPADYFCVLLLCRAEAGANRELLLVSRLLREQWIRAKYERNEFEFIEKQEPYSAGMCALLHLRILRWCRRGSVNGCAEHNSAGLVLERKKRARQHTF